MAPQETSPRSTLQPARILHVGGTEEERALVRRLLEGEGHAVLEVPPGPRAVELARGARPELVLLDLAQSEEEGYETATRLRSLPETREVPVVTLGPQNDRDRALSLGCDGFIATPLEPGKFVREIRAYLKGKRQRVRPTVKGQHLEAYSRTLVEKLQAKVDELTHTNEQLRQLGDLKNQILENVSHELATPLTPLLGYLDLLESGRLGPLNQRQRRALTAIAHGVRRLGRTVDNLLDLATLEEARTPPPHVEPIDPGAVGQEAVEALHPKARSRKVEVGLRYPAPVRVRADRKRLGQALIHLLDNAVAFSPRGGHVLLEIVRAGDRIQFSVYDQGEVIPADLEPQAFELFTPPGRRSAEGGIGPTLGLAVVRRIAESHGGEAWVESPPRKQPETLHPYPGARFGMTLPAAESPIPSEGGAEGEPPTEA